MSRAIRVTGVVVVLAGTIWLAGRIHAGHTGPGILPQRPRPIEEPAEKGLQFRVSAATPEAPPLIRPPLAPVEPLDESSARALFDRLPPLPAALPDPTSFSLRERSLPPPRPGRTVPIEFPAPTAATAPEVPAPGPLTVVRRSPEGPVPIAPQVSVTFSAPMVAISSHGEPAAELVPVRLTPTPTGTWRWVGTKTLLFDPPARLPMATDYTVEVPAGTQAAGGAQLVQTVRWTFSTPPPSVVTMYPNNRTTVRTPVIVLVFDQHVRPADVLAVVRLRAGKSAATLRLATADEVAADEDAARLVATSEPDRRVALRPQQALPAASRVTLIVGPGTPSAEGPRRAASAQEFSFLTFGPLRVTGQDCGEPDDPCSPSTSWRIRFSNRLDQASFDESQIQIEPSVTGLRTMIIGDWLGVSASFAARTAYRVTLSPDISDEYGQTLETAQTLTFRVGDEAARLWGLSGLRVTLDPTGDRHLSVFSINIASLAVQVYAVQPEDYPSYLTAWQNLMRSRQQPSLPGRRVFSGTLRMQGAANEVRETRIDLSPALANGLGHAVVLVEPRATIVTTTRARSTDADRQLVWVQSTRIGLDAFADAEHLVAWTTALDTGQPLVGVEMVLVPSGTRALTGADGLATLALGAQGDRLLVARLGQDRAFEPAQSSIWDSGSAWRRSDSRDRVRWYVTDDRHLYRPGEEARLKGWLRLVGDGPTGDVRAYTGGARNVSYRLADSRGNEIARGVRSLDSFGGFDVALKLPDTMNLGFATVTLDPEGSTAGSDRHVHRFNVQEFRRPEFEVTARTSEGPHLVGGHATVTVRAAYFAGGPLADAAVRWTIFPESASFRPPNYDDYIFGTWVPWWEPEGPRAWRPPVTFEGRTDVAGEHAVRLDFDRAVPPRPESLRVEGAVADVNRQTWTASSRILVHPAAVYVGLRQQRYFVQRGSPIAIDLIVVDLDGRVVPGRPVTVRAERLEWVQEHGEWVERVRDPQTCTIESARQASTCTFKTPEGGSYRVLAHVTDAAGRVNESELRVWVTGGRTRPVQKVEQETVTLVPDKREYRGGETAEILVVAPFAPAEGLLTLRRSGLLKVERFKMATSSDTLRIALDPQWTPNIHVQVDLVGAAPRTDDTGQPLPALPARPAFASGSLELKIPPLDRRIAVTAVPRQAALEPRGSTIVDVSLNDHAGRPVAGGSVALIVVDEAVLALVGRTRPDPVDVFYIARPEGTRDYRGRASVVLAPLKPPAIAGGGGGLGGGAGAVAENVRVTAGAPMLAAAPMAPEAEQTGELPGLTLRTDFSALALFEPAVQTDARGHAEVTLRLPDNLTRYRIVALAATADRSFGMGESTVTARLPLMVRPSAPRFLNYGDRAELPIVIQNQTDAPLAASVAMRATHVELPAGSGRRVSVPAHDRVEVRFPVEAVRPGTAHFQVVAAAGRMGDASQFQLSVWTPATTEAFATYGQIDGGTIAHPVRAPTDAVRQFGGLEVTVSSTALQALTDAVLYLVAYPFECSEQIASRVASIAALRDVLAAFRAKGLPPADELIARVKQDVQDLARLQNDDGGFAFWRRGDPSWPYLSIFVAHALERARWKGFDIPEQVRERSRRYLRDIDRHIPASYSRQVRLALQAYALHVQALMGDGVRERAMTLIRQEGVEALPVEAAGWLLTALATSDQARTERAALRRLLGNRVTETASTAQFTVSYGDGDYLLLASSRRADAIVLDGLISDQPTSDLIPKLVGGLLAHRVAGRWSTTQENTFVLLALDRYFGTYEQVVPDFVARLWLGPRYAGEQAFRGRTTDRAHLEIPMAEVAAAGAGANLILAADGKGRLYYRIGMQYAPASLSLAPSDHGFTVERRYEAVGDKADVMREADGTWRVKAGATVRVRLTMVAPERRYHVALVDPLPAGFEALNPGLATTGTIPADRPDTSFPDSAAGGGLGARTLSSWWWQRPWFEHQNLRDERAEAFAALLWEGVHSYSYVARATTPGEFIVPPPKAEQMYHPETFGRGSTDRVIVR